MKLITIIALASAIALGDGCGNQREQTKQATDSYAGDWVLDPKVPGPDLPAAGRSLFDHVVGDAPPFPFAATLRKIEEHLGPVRIERILIPLGRSLQRSIASPDFFQYPRAIAVVDSEPPGRVMAYLKDRLFLGYQEKANVIEVLSYNEAAGRFEFQLVKDYRQGAAPRVFYASRAVCITCHQNQAPIFSRQLWDETNANPRISQLLLAHGRAQYDFPIQQTADVPYQVDNAVHRANELSAYQLLWREGAGDDPRGAASIRLRARWLAEILEYRLCNARGFERGPLFRTELLEPLQAHWRKRWPKGLAIPNPEIPNRNPLSRLSRGGPKADSEMIAALTEQQKQIEPQFEPAIRRPPLEIWRATDEDRLERVILGLSNFLAEDDVRTLDRRLAKLTSRQIEYRASCSSVLRRESGAINRIALNCSALARGGFALNGAVHVRSGRVTGGNIDRVQLNGGGELRNLDVAGGTLIVTGDRVEGVLQLAFGVTGLHPRLDDGNRIDQLRLQAGTASLIVRSDFERAKDAIADMARLTVAGTLDVFSSKPFRRSKIMQALGERLEMSSATWCCLDDEGLPPPRLEKPSH